MSDEKKERTQENSEETKEDKKEDIKEDKPLSNLPELYDKIKAENDRTEALIKKQEDLISRRLLGGSTNAGDVEGIKKEETPKEYTNRIMRGG